MDISPINPNAPAQESALSASPLQRPEYREIAQAVKAVNSAELFGQDTQLLFVRDAETQRMVIRMVNRQTNEVIRQIPPEYVLLLAKDLQDSQG